MKKILLFACLALIVVGCEKKTDVEKTNSDKIAQALSCIDLTGYDSENDVNEKAKWLRLHGHEVCPKFLTLSAENDHFLLNDVGFNRYPGSLEVKWSDIKSLMKDYIYQKYIVVETSVSNTVVKIDTIDAYDRNKFCFSMPLFRGIDDRYKSLKDDARFIFTKADYGVTPAMVIEVIQDGNTLAYYDYSDRPKAVDLSKNKKSPL